MPHTRITKATAITSIVLGLAWILTILLSLDFFSNREWNVIGVVFTTLCFLPSILSISSGISLYKRPSFENLKLPIGTVCYTASILLISTLSAKYSFHSLSLIILPGSLLYYSLTRYLSNKAGFAENHPSSFFNRNFNTLFTLFLWLDLNSISLHISHDGLFFQTGSFLLVTAIACFVHVKLSKLLRPLAQQNAPPIPHELDA